MKEIWIEGLVPAVFTPLHEDGSLNLQLIRPIVDHLVANKAAAIYVCGSTGEGPSLSVEERMKVTQAYVDAAAGRTPIIVQVGHNSLSEARRMSQHAQAIGADAISAVPPSYFKVGSLDVLIACLKEITDGAPDLPFYYYHIPHLTATNVDVVQFIKLCSERLPNLVGVKYSTPTIYELQACVDLDNGRFNMLFGSDEMLLSGLIGGAHGAVGSTYNFAMPLYYRVIDAFKRNDIAEAQKNQGLSVKMIQVIGEHSPSGSYGPALKAMMGLIDLDCGPVRLPQVTLPPTEIAAMRQNLEAIGFFEWGIK
jgi:N-acetylneuraminate lyase